MDFYIRHVYNGLYVLLSGSVVPRPAVRRDILSTEGQRWGWGTVIHVKEGRGAI